MFNAYPLDNTADSADDTRMAESAVSILTTVYNREAFLAEAIESVLNQTFADWELILYDDGSTDRSLPIAQDYASRDSRIRLIRGNHLGVCGACDAALQAATGEFVGWLDSDDSLMPTALEECVKVLREHPKVGFVYTQYEDMDEAGNVRGLGLRTQVSYSPQRLLIDFMTFHFRLIRRQAVLDVGGIDPTHPAAWDYDLCLRLSEHVDVAHIRKPLYRYRHHRKTISHDEFKLQAEASAKAVQRAIKRRGIAGEVDLHLEWRPRFVIKDKSGNIVKPDSLPIRKS